MEQRQYSEQDMIQITSRSVHGFYERRPRELISRLSDDFIWIGAFDFQWSKNVKEFCAVTKGELQEKEVTLSDEEYHVLYHSGPSWLLYGRYTASVELGEGKIWVARVRGTYVWQQAGNNMQLLHIHGSHAQDYSIAPVPYAEDMGFFDYIKKMNFIQPEGKVSVSQDRTEEEYQITSHEIMYFKSANQYCHVATHSRKFLVRGGIQTFEKKFPDFVRIHRCYLVNPIMIKSICRYKVILHNGEELPVSQGRYIQVRKQLAEFGV